jgi:hypothetical protein
MKCTGDYTSYLHERNRQGLCRIGSSIRRAVWKRLPQVHSADNAGVTDWSLAVSTNHPETPRAGNWLENLTNQLPGACHARRHLTADECAELAEALRQDAAALSNSSKKEAG